MIIFSFYEAQVSSESTAIECGKTAMDGIEVATDTKLVSLQHRILELEGLVERLENRLIQCTGYIENHAETLETYGRDIEDVREYLGIIPQKIELFDGIRVRVVEHLHQRPRYVPSKYPVGLTRQGDKEVDTGGYTSGPGGTKIVALTGAVSASAPGPTNSGRGVGEAEPIAVGSASAPPFTSASGSRSVLVSASTIRPQPLADSGLCLGPPALPQTIETVGAAAGRVEPVTAPRSTDTPAVMLIPATPQTAQEAANYAAIQLLADRAQHGAEVHEGTGREDMENAGQILGDVVLEEGGHGMATGENSGSQVPRHADVPLEADADAIPIIGEANSEHQEGAVGGHPAVIPDVERSAEAITADGTRIGGGREVNHLGELEGPGGQGTSLPDDTNTVTDTSPDADADIATPRLEMMDHYSHLRPPRPQSPGSSPSPRPRSRSRSRHSPIPPEQLRRSPRLHSLSPVPQASSPRPLKRALPDEGEEIGGNKRAKLCR